MPHRLPMSLRAERGNLYSLRSPSKIASSPRFMGLLATTMGREIASAGLASLAMTEWSVMLGEATSLFCHLDFDLRLAFEL